MKTSEDQMKGSSFSDGGFPVSEDLQLGFASSDDEEDESVDSAGSSSSSSSSSVSLSNPNGPLYELSDLMAQLPIKRGLSRWYAGRSQSYISLTSVRTLEDLMKKEIPPDCNKSFKKLFSPKKNIYKNKKKTRNHLKEIEICR